MNLGSNHNQEPCSLKQCSKKKMTLVLYKLNRTCGLLLSVKALQNVFYRLRGKSSDHLLQMVLGGSPPDSPRMYEHGKKDKNDSGTGQVDSVLEGLRKGQGKQLCSCWFSSEKE